MYSTGFENWQTVLISDDVGSEYSVLCKPPRRDRLLRVEALSYRRETF